MRKFSIVLKYELREYVKNKSFVVVTLLLAIIGAIVLFAPRFFDMSWLVGTPSEQQVTVSDEETKGTMLLYDSEGLVNQELLSGAFPNVTWVEVDSVDAIKDKINSEEALAGFRVVSYTEYDYYILNRGIYSVEDSYFEAVLSASMRQAYFTENNLNADEIEALFATPITMNEQVLGKDSTDNYWYSYALVIIVFMLIVFYGQMIAVSVTNEKSNRAIEILVTTTTPNSLLFGKVIAGAIAGLCQVGVVLGAVLISYQMNRELWGGKLDMILNIPTEVLITFALFGIGGYLFYAFLYGAMGALVSKTEDISKSSSGLMIMIMIVYFISLMQLSNVDGIAMKVLSFLPISSYSAMFVRIAMGTVEMWEIVVSFVILVASIFAAGLIGAGIYRMGTLRYGNPVRLTSALKELKRSK